jgi:uncharacterized membrane protein YtjA (UPF0391 family)
MLKWAFIFLVIAIVAGLPGFTGVAVAAASIAKFLFGIFLAIFLCFSFWESLPGGSCSGDGDGLRSKKQMADYAASQR